MSIKETYSKEFLISLLDEMLLIRSFEDKALASYGIKKINGFLHVCTGQEAISTGSIRAIDLARDYVITGYRDHGHGISCKIHPNNLMAELYGKRDGVVGGRGGSMHFFSKDQHLLGGHGIVGAQIGIGTGSALTSKYLKDLGKIDEYFVTLDYFGDGAVHQGIFHESLNMASLWNLPILYILENNHYGMGTSTQRANSTADDFSKKAIAYGIDYVKVNGNDVIEVYEKTKEIVDTMRKDGKPKYMEIKTYRYKGHSVSDPQTYRTRDEIEDYRKKYDAIDSFKMQLINENIITEEDYDNLKAKNKKIIQDSADFAENNKEPAPDTLLRYNLI